MILEGFVQFLVYPLLVEQNPGNLTRVYVNEGEKSVVLCVCVCVGGGV